MPPVNYDVVFYPTTSLRASKEFDDVRDVMTEFRAALTRHLVKEEELCEPDDVRDIKLDSVKAKALMIDAKAHAHKVAKAKLKSKLQVSGGIDKTGNLVISVVDAERANNYSKSAIVRKDFVQTVIKLFRKQKNVVANIQPDDDELIRQAAERQAAKYRTTVQKGDQAVDVGGIKFGTIVLAAHGGRAKVSGTILGTDLGLKTPAQIVALLTENRDPAKRLHPKFKGTIILSGCFTAAGNAVIPPGYDYSVFAAKVKQLLDKKGYQNYLVKGMAGPSRTTPSGDKEVIPTADDDVVEMAKEKLARKKAEAAEAERRFKLLEAKQTELEKQQTAVVDMYRKVAAMATQQPGNTQLAGLKPEVLQQYGALEDALKVASQEVADAKNLVGEKRTKLLKRMEKLVRSTEQLATKYSAEGIVTFGQRTL
jgi:hypothetical protein